MKHKLITLVLFFSLILPAGFAAAEVETLRVVGTFSSLTMYKNFEEPLYKEMVPKELGVEVSLTTLSQIKLGGPALLRQMGMGVFDIVHTITDYVVEDSPALAGLDLPALATDIETARKIVDAYRPVMEKYLEQDFGVKLLSITPYPAQVLFLRDKISGLNDLKGLKIRASGWTTSEFVTALGATGVTMSFSEVPQALQRGVVDGGVTGSLSGYSAGWGEVAKYVYPLPMGGWDYVIGTISLDTWDKLSKEQKNKLTGLLKTNYEEPVWKVTGQETLDGISCLCNGDCPNGDPNNLIEIPVTQADKDMAYKVLVEKVLPAWAKKVKPETVKEWNDSIGKVVGLTAK
ncbi:MAG: TRAP transporter substrate-binding protein [Desulfotignum sp.]|jgi:TRAP-type C4-dicarboxylate transport system substrate-binding protein|nr:TRAP transporter substrate-binding protein [Desulfotignum sp.]